MHMYEKKKSETLLINVTYKEIHPYVQSIVHT